LFQSTTIRRFRWHDLIEWTELFNDVCGNTGTASAFDVELAQQFLSQPACRPEENCFLAESNGSMVGFTLISPELRIGRSVASGGVVESHRRGGIGRMLLEAAVSRAEELGTSVLHVQTSSDSDAARHLLESSGFRLVRIYSLMRWEGEEVPQPDPPPGFRLRAFRRNRDEEAITQLQNASFAASWGFCPNTVDEIEARLRLKTCDPDGVIFATHGDRMAGYNWTFKAIGPGSSIGWIGMTGVHPEYRGYGLGKVVALAGMEFLTAQGVRLIELEVDEQNDAAKDIYLSIGFVTAQERPWYERSIGI